MTPNPTTTKPRARTGDNPFRYSAAVTGTGETQTIQEFIGRRFVRYIDPRSRLGRRLITSGQVSLWCDTVAEGERLPVTEVLGRLHDQVLRDLHHSGADEGRDRSCRCRLEAIESWQAFFGSDPTAGH
jgi:hypothetical protein